MWNTGFVLPSLMVLAILLIYYFILPRLLNRLNRAFLILIITDIATVLTDVISTRADEHYQSLPVWLVSALNLLYFIAYIIRIIAFFRLTMVLLKLDRPGFTWKKILVYFVFAVSELIVLSSPFTGAVYTVDGTGYHRGPLYQILAVCLRHATADQRRCLPYDPDCRQYRPDPDTTIPGYECVLRACDPCHLPFL